TTLARGLAGILALGEDSALAELAGILAAAGETMALAVLDRFRRESRAAFGREGVRLEIVGRMVRALNSSLAGTAEPLHGILRAVIGETGAERGFLMLYATPVSSPSPSPASVQEPSAMKESGGETLRFEL